jgi:hypothetical protein
VQLLLSCAIFPAQAGASMAVSEMVFAAPPYATQHLISLLTLNSANAARLSHLPVQAGASMAVSEMVIAAPPHRLYNST